MPSGEQQGFAVVTQDEYITPIPTTPEGSCPNDFAFALNSIPIHAIVISKINDTKLFIHLLPSVEDA